MEEKIFEGISLNDGIAIGEAFFFSDHPEKTIEHAQVVKNVDQEIFRYRQALQNSRSDLENLQKRFQKDAAEDIVSILVSHLEMLKDPFLTEMMEEKIRTSQKNSEVVFRMMMQEYTEQFVQEKNNFFQEKIKDIEDVSRRVLKYLRPLAIEKHVAIPENSIILAIDIVPSDALELSSKTLAFITERGGNASHAAIIARAKDIPYVAKIPLSEIRGMEIEKVIVDGIRGLVIINPKEETLNKYQRILEERQNKEQAILQNSSVKTTAAEIYGNLDSPKDIDLVFRYGASGVGLFRTEFLFLTKEALSENSQYELYKEIAEKLYPHPFVIRLFDVGGDKGQIFSVDTDSMHEMNPALGCRGIRFLLKNPQILITQLRAILRASNSGNISILIPMISDISEYRLVQEMVHKLQKDLLQEGVESGKISIGCMIEVPSSAILADVFAKEADFLSIGTNDLTQYVLAADRNNFDVPFYNLAHVSVLRLLKNVIKQAEKYHKPVTLCGEMAAEIKLLPILMGLGVKKFSISLRKIPLVKEEIGKISPTVAKKAAKKIFSKKALGIL